MDAGHFAAMRAKELRLGGTHLHRRLDVARHALLQLADVPRVDGAFDAQPRDIQQGQATDAAIGGEQNGEEALSGTAEPRAAGGRSFGSNTGPSYSQSGLASPDSVLTTAEDGLLGTARRKGPRPICLLP